MRLAVKPSMHLGLIRLGGGVLITRLPRRPETTTTADRHPAVGFRSMVYIELGAQS